MPDDEQSLDQPEAEAQDQPEAQAEEPAETPAGDQPEGEATEQGQAEEQPAAARPRRRTARTGTATETSTRTRTRRRAATAEAEPEAESSVAEKAPSEDESPPPRLRQMYREEIVPSLMREFGLSNPMQVPRIQKIVLNIGLGEALTNGRAMESATRDLATIAGQKPIITRARKSIAGFKIREGNPIGTCVTLRGARMYHFLDRFINMSLPRIRDFRGIPRRGFDGRGNFSMGIHEQIIFPEVDYNQIDRIRGLQVTIATTAQDDAIATRLLELYGMPFVREA